MTGRPSRPVQQGLFGPLQQPADSGNCVAPALHPAELWELGRKLPKGLRLGTSSWNFPGWRGLVYAEDAPTRLLSSQGLHAYSQHPLFATVGLDRTFYAPVGSTELAAYAAAVPGDFRFLVKAWGELLGPVPGRAGVRSKLDVEAILRHCVEPAVEGLREKLGVILLQFPPQGAAMLRTPERFADRLYELLGNWPRGVVCAVELRDAGLLTAEYAAVLRDTGARHCYALHPGQPGLARQRELVPVDGSVFLRWLLRTDLDYEQAKQRYQPFGRLVDPDPANREAIILLARQALQQGVPMTIVVNNKAEGCAPESVRALAQRLIDMASSIEPSGAKVDP